MISLVAVTLLLPAFASAWDGTYGRGGEAVVPDSSKASNRQVMVCSRAANGRTLVVGAFGGDFYGGGRRLATAVVSREGRVVKRRGRIWHAIRRTPRYGTGVYALSGGGALVSTSTSELQTLRRVDSLGRIDRRFGGKGSITFVKRYDDRMIFPLADGGFLTHWRTDSGGGLTRYRRDGRRVAGFMTGHSSWWVSAAAGGDDGAVFLAGSVGTGPAIIKLRADGSLDPSFGNGGVWSTQPALPDGVTDVAYGFGHVYAIARQLTSKPGDGPSYDIRIVELGATGNVAHTSGVVDFDGYPGDGGKPERVQRSLRVTANGVVFFSSHAWYTFPSFGLKASRWPLDLGELPLAQATWSESLSGSDRYSESFAPESSVVAGDGKSLVSCGSLGQFKNKPYGGTRHLIALQRLLLP